MIRIRGGDLQEWNDYRVHSHADGVGPLAASRALQVPGTLASARVCAPVAVLSPVPDRFPVAAAAVAGRDVLPDSR